MRRALTFAGCFVVIAALAVAPARADVGAREIAGGLQQPVAFTFGPDRQLWYVEKDSGEIRVIDLATGDDRLFETVGGVNGEGERGMLGIALHPRYPGRPFVYVYATRSVSGSLRNQILRYQDHNGSGANIRTIFSSPASSSPYHNGGRILFGPDRKLYAIVGDGHSAANAQDTSKNLRGKILRLNPDGSRPRTNPVIGGKRSRIFAYGIRNSFGFAFDPQNRRLWETENGPSCNDEINLVRPGGNYAWGSHQSCPNTNQDGPAPRRLPKVNFSNPIGITGAVFCDGCGLAGREGDLLFGDCCGTGAVRRVVLNATRDDVLGGPVTMLNAPGSVYSMEAGPDGRIYFSDSTSIFRLRNR